MSAKPKAPPVPVKRPPRPPGLAYCAAGILLLCAALAVYQVFVLRQGNSGRSYFSSRLKFADDLASRTQPIPRDELAIPLSAMCRELDAALPEDARVFFLNALGQENSYKMPYYFFLTYYLFPRHIDVSFGEPPRFTMQGMDGREPESTNQLARAGYDVVVDFRNGVGHRELLRPLAKRGPPPSIPDGDALPAFLLPLATALAGTRLLRLLFRDAEGLLSAGELLACGLAFGALFATQIVLALRMAGARLEQPLTLALLAWGAVELALWIARAWKERQKLNARQGFWLLLLPAALVLWSSFRLAGLEGLREFDAVSFWAFKAKVFHECAGQQLWVWFKDPGMAYAHLDYPLVGSLIHSLTYGLIGHVNEFVTKYWSQWMLVLLAWAMLGSAGFPRKSPWLAASAATLFLLMPMTLNFGVQEGATIPMVFFTAISSLQLALGLAENQPARIRLGVFLLMAAAMVKFEGMLLLGFWGILLLADRNGRAALWPPRRALVPVAAGLAAWLPYIVFRLHRPVIHPESKWMLMMIQNIGIVLHNAPMTCLEFLSRRFLNQDFATWTVDPRQHAVWSGTWAGLPSLVDVQTRGAGWLALLFLVVLWLRGAGLKWTALKLGGVFLALTLTIGVVWTCTHSAPDDYLGSLEGSNFETGGRYLFPVLMSWFLVSAVILGRLRASPSAGDPSAAAPSNPRPAPGSKLSQKPGDRQASTNRGVTRPG